MCMCVCIRVQLHRLLEVLQRLVEHAVGLVHVADPVVRMRKVGVVVQRTLISRERLVPALCEEVDEPEVVVDGVIVAALLLQGLQKRRLRGAILP